MPLNSEHTEASFSPTSTDSLYLWINQVPRCQDLAILVVTTDRQTDKPTTYPCACMWSNNIGHVCTLAGAGKHMATVNRHGQQSTLIDWYTLRLGLCQTIWSVPQLAFHWSQWIYYTYKLLRCLEFDIIWYYDNFHADDNRLQMTDKTHCFMVYPLCMHAG